MAVVGAFIWHTGRMAVAFFWHTDEWVAEHSVGTLYHVVLYLPPLCPDALLGTSRLAVEAAVPHKATRALAFGLGVLCSAYNPLIAELIFQPLASELHGGATY